MRRARFLLLFSENLSICFVYKHAVRCVTLFVYREIWREEIDAHDRYSQWRHKYKQVAQLEFEMQAVNMRLVVA